MTLKEEVKPLAAAGFSVIPIRDTKTKQPTIRWDVHKDRQMTNSEIDLHFPGAGAVAVVCGAASQNVELIDIDLKYDVTGNLLSDYTDLIKELGGESLLSRLVVQKTVNKGIHFIYRCSKVEGNQKLARRPATEEEQAKSPHEKVKVLIETRGEGGYFLCSPSPGYEFEGPDLLSLPTITTQERQILLDAARALNQYAEAEHAPRGEQKEYADGESPFDDFDQKIDMVHLLEHHGWKVVGRRGDTCYLRRPGKSEGLSATWNHIPGRFYCFTTSTEFEERKVYRPYAVYTVLNHGGDFLKSCKALLAEGYGKAHQKSEESGRSAGKFEQSERKEGSQEREPIEKQLQTSPELPKDIYHNMPQLLQQGCKAFNSYRECDVFVTSALVILSGMFPKVSGVYNGARVNANLFGFIVAPAASGKSALVWAKRLGQAYHKDLVEQSRRLYTEYEARLSDHQQAKRNAKKGEVVEPPPDQPPFKVLFIPANNSSASIISTLAQSDGQGIIAESEADTLSGSISQDWGNFSDLLRKAFHHESYTYQRKTGKEFFEIDEPKLSIALSGTPSQVVKLIASSEDGLFSRFLFYSYALDPQWRDVSPAGQRVTLNDHFDELSRVVFSRIIALTEDIDFHLTGEQWQRLNGKFSGWLNQISKIVGQQASSSVYRMGLICFRLAMVLSTIRCFEEPVISEGGRMECLDKDFNIALSLCECYLQHAIIMYSRLPKDSGPQEVDDKKALFFHHLPDSFVRGDIEAAAKAVKVSMPTADRYLKELLTKGLLDKEQHGKYVKAK